MTLRFMVDCQCNLFHLRRIYLKSENAFGYQRPDIKQLVLYPLLFD